MPLSKSEISYKLNLSKELEGETLSKKKEIKRAVAKFVLEEIESFTKSEVSPVTDHGFDPLNKAYAKVKKKLGKGSKADLHLKGKMISSIKAVTGGIDSVVFKINQKKQLKKAFNHITGDTLPKRPFLPNDKLGVKSKYGSFSPSIKSGIRDIIKGLKNGKG